MNALPISVNPQPALPPCGVATAASGKAASGPGFAQVLADKQSATNTLVAHAPASQPDSNRKAPTPPETQSTSGNDSSSASAAGHDANPTATPSAAAHGTATSRKGALKEKAVVTASAIQSFATQPAAASAIPLNALVPVTLPSGLPDAAPASSNTANASGSAGPATASPSQAGVVPAVPPVAQVPQQTAIPLASPSANAGEPSADPAPDALPPLTALPAEMAGTQDAQAAANGGDSPVQAKPNPPAPTTLDATTPPPSPSPSGAAATLAAELNANLATHLAAPVDAPALANAANPSSTPVELLPPAEPGTQSDTGPGKAETPPRPGDKHDFLEALRGLTSGFRKGVQLVAHGAEAVAKDAADAAKPNNAPDDSGPATGSLHAVDPSTSLHTSVKTDAATPPAAQPAPPQPAANPNGATDAALAGNNSNAKDSANSDDDPGASSDSGANDLAPSVQAASNHTSLQPNQIDPGNPAGVMASHGAATMSAAAAREDGGAAKPANTNATDSSSAAPQDAEAPRLPALDSRAVNAAQLTGNDAHSEVRIAMQADQLGQVQLHATLNGQQVGAAITVEKKEAHAAMALELPSLQQALEEHHLRVNEVVLTQGALHSFSGNAGNPGNPGHSGNAPAGQGRGNAAMQYRQGPGNSAYRVAPPHVLESTAMFDNYGRLSVRV